MGAGWFNLELRGITLKIRRVTVICVAALATLARWLGIRLTLDCLRLVCALFSRVIIRRWRRGLTGGLHLLPGGKHDPLLFLRLFGRCGFAVGISAFSISSRGELERARLQL